MVVLIVAAGLLFGCTGGGGKAIDANAAVKITSGTQAANAANDAASDISGISDSLNNIDKALTDSNS